MTRLVPLAPPYEPEVAVELEKLMPQGMEPIALFRTVAHNPRVLRRLRRGGLLDAGSISLRERELVILRTTALCGAEYEWGVHVAFFAKAAGLSDDEVAATVSGLAERVPAHERALFALCEALQASSTVDDALWARLAERRSAAQLVELVVLAGQYRGIAAVTNALALPREPGAPRFADAGVSGGRAPR
jgi:alkylhydroperoxidase family enzyme